MNFNNQHMHSQNQENLSFPRGTILYRFNGVPVVAGSSFWPMIVLLTGVLSWIAGLRKPERSILQRLGLGLLATPVALFAEIGHAMAHTISARLAGAPMDEILLSSEMTRTLYENNDVTPQTHIMRSLGGPLFNLIGFILSLLWRRHSPAGSLSRDLADVSLFGHSVILFGSFAPLPMIDGGIILKWKLVEGGKSPEQADQIIRKTNLRLGAAFLGLGALQGLFRKRKLVGVLLAACGVVGIAAGKGWLK